MQTKEKTATKEIGGSTNDCKKGNHSLIEILRDRGWDCESVARWCKVCGAVVVDIDYDGRTNPGAIAKMRFPEVLTKK